MAVLHLLGIVLVIFGLIGLIRPTDLHQAVGISKISLGNRWLNLIPTILGMAMLYSMINHIDFMYVLGMMIFIFGVVGIIYPTLMHQSVKFGSIHFGNRVWNLVWS